MKTPTSKLRVLTLCALGLLAPLGIAQAQTAGSAPKMAKPMAKPGGSKMMASGSKMSGAKKTPAKKGATMGTAVGLTSAQKKKVTAINKDAAAKRAAVTADKSLSASARTAKYKTIAAEKESQLKKVMSASQQAKYKSHMASKKTTKMAAKPASKMTPKMAPKGKM